MSAADTAAGAATYAVGTVATGPHHENNADNWSTNTVPINNDDFVYDSGEVDCCFNISTGIQPATFVKTKGYSGQIGLAEVNTDDSTYPYIEYRTKHLTFSNNAVTTTYTLEQGDGKGSPMVRIDAGAGRSTVNIYGKGPRADAAVPCILFNGTHISNEFNNLAGDLGLAYYASDSAHAANIRTGDGSGNGGLTHGGSGLDVIDAVVETSDGATLILNSATSSGQIRMKGGGDVFIYSGAHADVVIDGGHLRYYSSGSLGATQVVVANGGHLDKSVDMRNTVLATPAQLYFGAKVSDPHDAFTFSGASFKLNHCLFADVTISFGYDRQATLA
jgi:hypothetical protein